MHPMLIFFIYVKRSDEAQKNLAKSLDFMLTAHDYKSAGMIYRYLGLIEINNQIWKDAQKYFIKALNYHQQSQHRAAFEFTTLFLGLSYFYDDDFKQIEAKFPNFNYKVALSEPLPGDDWDGPVGFIHQVVQDNYLKDHEDPSEVEYYMCGPPMMNKAAIGMLHDLGVEDQMIDFDEFG